MGVPKKESLDKWVKEVIYQLSANYQGDTETPASEIHQQSVESLTERHRDYLLKNPIQAIGYIEDSVKTAREYFLDNYNQEELDTYMSKVSDLTLIKTMLVIINMGESVKDFINRLPEEAVDQLIVTTEEFHEELDNYNNIWKQLDKHDILGELEPFLDNAIDFSEVIEGNLNRVGEFFNQVSHQGRPLSEPAECYKLAIELGLDQGDIDMYFTWDLSKLPTVDASFLETRWVLTDFTKRHIDILKQFRYIDGPLLNFLRMNDGELYKSLIPGNPHN